MLAIVLALGTSAAYGAGNFLGPLLGRRHALAAILLTGQAAALAGAALLVLASGSAAPSMHAVLFGLLAGAGNVLGLATFLRASQETSVSVVSAIGASAGTAIPVLYGVATGEALSAVQVAGIVVALGGGVLTAQSSDHAVVTTGGVIWSLISAVGFGVLLTALPEAAEGGTAWAILDARIAVVVLLVAGLIVLRAPARAPVRDLPVLAIPGLLLLCGTLLYAEATQHGQLSVVAVLASLSTVVTAVLAFGLQHERLSRVQRAGILLATAGVCLLVA